MDSKKVEETFMDRGFKGAQRAPLVLKLSIFYGLNNVEDVLLLRPVSRSIKSYIETVVVSRAVLMIALMDYGNMPGKKILSSVISAYPREAWRLHHKCIILFCQPLLCEYLEKDQNTMTISFTSLPDGENCLYLFATRDRDKWGSYTWLTLPGAGAPFLSINHNTPNEVPPVKEITLSLWHQNNEWRGCEPVIVSKKRKTN